MNILGFLTSARHGALTVAIIAVVGALCFPVHAQRIGQFEVAELTDDQWNQLLDGFQKARDAYHRVTDPVTGQPLNPDSGYENIDDTGPISVSQDPEGFTIIGYDIVKGMGNEKVVEANWLMKIPVGLVEGIKAVPKDVVSRPWQWATAGLVTLEATTGKVSDAWDSAFGSSSSGDGQPAQKANVTLNAKTKATVRDADPNQSYNIKAEEIDLDFYQGRSSL